MVFLGLTQNSRPRTLSKAVCSGHGSWCASLPQTIPVVYLSPLSQVPGGQGAGLIDEQSVPVIVNPVPDTPRWSVPEFPLMAAEDEAMMVPDVSVSDPDGEEYLRITVSAEKGYVSLPRAASRDLTGVEEGVREDDDGRQALIMVGSEIALNEALKGLAYYPPPDWTSFREVLHGRCVSSMSSTRERGREVQ